jgi:hypothetical protein
MLNLNLLKKKKKPKNNKKNTRTHTHAHILWHMSLELFDLSVFISPHKPNISATVSKNEDPFCLVEKVTMKHCCFE